MTAVRTAPRPPFEGVAGACNMCGGPLTGRARSWCSKACVDWWWLATDRKVQLRQMVALHGRACWCCGATEWYPDRAWLRRKNWSMSHFVGPVVRPVELEVDHVRPLWSLTTAERADLRWWLPYNLQLLCRDCHKAKTKREAGIRAGLKRLGPAVVDLDLSAAWREIAAEGARALDSQLSLL